MDMSGQFYHGLLLIIDSRYVRYVEIDNRSVENY